MRAFPSFRGLVAFMRVDRDDTVFVDQHLQLVGVGAELFEKPVLDQVAKHRECCQQFGEVMLIDVDGAGELDDNHCRLGRVVELLAGAEFQHSFLESCAEPDFFESVQGVDQIEPHILDVLDVRQLGDVADNFSHVLPHTSGRICIL